MKPLLENCHEIVLPYQESFENRQNDRNRVFESKHFQTKNGVGKNVFVDTITSVNNKGDEIKTGEKKQIEIIKSSSDNVNIKKQTSFLSQHKNTAILNDINTKNHHITTTTNNIPTINKQNHNNTSTNLSTTSQLHHGNYPHYYGYRHPSSSDDVDSRVLLMEASWFNDKEVLDVGCNAGKVTLEVARVFGPKRVVGLDIDQSLIMSAKKNLKQYNQRCLMKKSKQSGLSCKRKLNETGDVDDSKRFKNETEDLKVNLNSDLNLTNIPNKNVGLVNNSEDKLSSKCLLNNGNITACKDVIKINKIETPLRNVFFIQADYVPDEDVDITRMMPEFDVILALSVSKWMHLNYADKGLKKAFEKMYRQLRDGGLLVLEPQDWSSYRKKKKMMTQTTYSCKDLQFKPQHFKDYLINSVGFKSCRLLGTSNHPSKGFQRQVLLFTK